MTACPKSQGGWHSAYDKVALLMDGHIMDAEIQNLTRQGVGRWLGLAPTLLRCRLMRKILDSDHDEETATHTQTTRRRKSSSATDRPPLPRTKRQRKSSSGDDLPHSTDLKQMVQLGSAGCRYQLLHDNSCLSELLMVCSTCSQLLPEVTSQEDLVDHMQEFAVTLTKFPSFLGFGGDYIGPTVLRKHLLGLMTRVRVEWKDISRATLAAWSVDKGNYLSTIPDDWAVEDLHRELGIEPIYISMWCCLFREVETLGPRAVHSCRFRVPELRTLLTAYKKKHGIPPCPYILVSQLLEADGLFTNHRSRAEAKSEFLLAKLTGKGSDTAGAT